MALRAFAAHTLNAEDLLTAIVQKRDVGNRDI